MSRTFSISFNSDELIKMCSLLNVRENNLAKSVKAMLLEKTHSEFYPAQFMENIQSKEDMHNELIDDPKKIKAKNIDDFNLVELEKVKGDITTEELRKYLGISKTELRNKIDSRGLYGGVNFENYVRKFTDNWYRNFDLIPEFLFRVNLEARGEMLTKEYIERKHV